MKHVFIIGSKGIPAAYGGYETFVDNLTALHENDNELQYHVACMGKDNSTFTYNGAQCFNVNVPQIGPARAIYYDLVALQRCITYIQEENISNPIVYILTCRIGPWTHYYVRKIHRLGGRLYLNPDGHEWLRAKWSYPVRKYWKMSERQMVSNADLVICDSQNIEQYIRDSYRKFMPRTTYIAYGSDVSLSKCEDGKFNKWLEEKTVSSNGYYLIVGRFVPENNFESMIREFMQSNTNKDLVIITTADGKFYQKLEAKYHFSRDNRVKFVGTVYDKELLKKIRENAYGYIHGHEVGGTNPSLLEALGSTKLNLLLNVGFNREVGKSAAFYWEKEQGSLAKLINSLDTLDDQEIIRFGHLAQKRILDAYSWNYIAQQYRQTFLQ